VLSQSCFLCSIRDFLAMISSGRSCFSATFSFQSLINSLASRHTSFAFSGENQIVNFTRIIKFNAFEIGGSIVHPWFDDDARCCLDGHLLCRTQFGNHPGVIAFPHKLPVVPGGDVFIYIPSMIFASMPYVLSWFQTSMAMSRQTKSPCSV